MASQLLLERRFGRGAARLPIGVPAGASPIASIARTNVPGERLGALLPSMLCAMLAVGALALTESRLNSNQELRIAEAPTIIELEAWQLAEPEPAARVEAQPIPANAIATTDEVDTSGGPMPAPIGLVDPAPAPPKPFDLSQLALRSAPAIPDATLEVPLADPTNVFATRRPGGLPTAKSVTDLALAVPANSERAFDGASTLANEGRVLADPEALRPVGAGTESTPEATAEWAIAEDRADFLATLAREQSAQRGVGASHGELPAVALSGAFSAAQEAVREQLNTQMRQLGWHEVPLDALPDCSPPGRQDALKRRILVAAEAKPTCQNTAGSYRFLETRNLNAFLMWSRTNPDGQQTAGSPRDVCDVLSRALDCLTKPSMEEIGTR